MLRSRRNRIGVLALVPLLLLAEACGRSEAKNGDAGASESATARAERSETVLPSGTTMTLKLDRTLSTKSASAGDPVSATVSADVRGPGGSVLVPAGSRMKGTVDRSQRSTGPDDQAVLAFHFNQLEVDGTSHPVTAAVEKAEPEKSEGDSGAETAAKIAIGAAAGAVVGQILGGNTSSTVKGAAAGTVAGTVVAVASKNGDARLPEGSSITVRTKKPVRFD